MIYAPVTTPAQLLAVLPHLLENEQEAADLLDQLQEETKPQGLRTWGTDLLLDDFIEEHTKAYTSLREAFEDLYPGDIDDWKADRCSDYQLCFSDFTDLYADWLDSNYTVYYIGENKLIILE